MTRMREILALEAFRGTKLVAGEKGLDRQVKWVSILELLDELSVLQEGELLITTAYGIDSDEELRQTLIDRLADAKLAGLAIQTGYYLDVIPPEFIERANERAFPLLELPKDMVFANLTRAVLSNIINHQFHKLEHSASIRTRLTEIVLQDRSIEDIARVLSSLIAAPVIIFSSRGEAICHAGGDVPADLNWSLAGGVGRRHLRPEGGDDLWLVLPVIAGNEIHGYIAARKGPEELTEEDDAALTHGTTVTALVMLKERAVAEVERKLKGDFLDDLLTGNFSSTQAIAKRASYLGYNLNECGVVMAIDYDGFDEFAISRQEIEVQSAKMRLNSVVARVIRSMDFQVMHRYRSDSVVLVAWGDREGLPARVERIIDRLREEEKELGGLTFSVGVGTVASGPAEVKRSFDEARYALRVGKAIWRRQAVAFYDRLGVYRLLYHVEDREELRRYFARTIGPLYRYDRDHGGKLVPTLRTFLEVGSLKEAADRLFLHRHSLRYRLRRIEEIGGVDLGDPEERFELRLGLAIMDALEPQERDAACGL